MPFRPDPFSIPIAKATALIRKIDHLAGRFAEPLVRALKPGGKVCKQIEGFLDAIKALSLTCFVAGTPLLTPDGEKPIEQFQVGDHILAKPENDPNAPVRVQTVEAVFELQATVLELCVGGQLIETTAEHPFYVAGQGWIRARDLQPGDPLFGHDERVTLVESISQTERARTVYNLRVSEDHTYFVGKRAWGFSVWVHNAYNYRKLADGTFEIFDDAGKLARKNAKLTGVRNTNGTWDIVDATDGFVVKKDVGMGDVMALGGNPSGAFRDLAGRLRNADGTLAFDGGSQAGGLSRPPLRTDTKAAIEANAKKNAAGQFVDSSGNVLTDWHYGHIFGHENRRILAAAEQLGLSQKQLNDYLNARPQFFQIEDAARNFSHADELLGKTLLGPILRDMRRFFGIDR